MDFSQVDSEEFAKNVAKQCHEVYFKLPKSGKPIKAKEWTLLSGIVMTTNAQKDPEVVSLATGTKCLGKSKVSDNGSLISDCHAEVLARRSFIKYLNQEFKFLMSGYTESSVLIPSEHGKNSYSLKPGVQFHLYISHTPCGDASIFPKPHYETGLNKRPIEEEEEVTGIKRPKLSNSVQIPDIYRTGAKSIEGQPVDPKLPGENYHVVNVVRTKPGRGDPTLSVSCSDKIARWNVCGIQGALLSRLLDKPIYLTSVIIGKCPYSKDALKRAIVDRCNVISTEDFPSGYIKSSPLLLQAQLCFESSKESVEKDNPKANPCSSAIIFSNVKSQPVEVCVDGRKQGTTLKNARTKAARLTVCKANLFNEHLEICELGKLDYKNLETYADFKESALNYHKMSNALKKSLGWTEKSLSLKQFKYDNFK